MLETKLVINPQKRSWKKNALSFFIFSFLGKCRIPVGHDSLCRSNDDSEKIIITLPFQDFQFLRIDYYSTISELSFPSFPSSLRPLLM